VSLARKHAAPSRECPTGLHWPWWVQAQAAFLKGDLTQVCFLCLLFFYLVLMGLLYKPAPMVASIDLHILLRPRPYPMRGHRLLKLLCLPFTMSGLSFHYSVSLLIWHAMNHNINSRLPCIESVFPEMKNTLVLNLPYTAAAKRSTSTTKNVLSTFTYHLHLKTLHS